MDSSLFEQQDFGLEWLRNREREMRSEHSRYRTPG
tara:strand:- start:150 stop:254 length:105 start_codon:yes stop_codon:yes gene_type:complete